MSSRNRRLPCQRHRDHQRLQRSGFFYTHQGVEVQDKSLDWLYSDSWDCIQSWWRRRILWHNCQISLLLEVLTMVEKLALKWSLHEWLMLLALYLRFLDCLLFVAYHDVVYLLMASFVFGCLATDCHEKLQSHWSSLIHRQPSITNHQLTESTNWIDSTSCSFVSSRSESCLFLFAYPLYGFELVSTGLLTCVTLTTSDVTSSGSY